MLFKYRIIEQWNERDMNIKLSVLVVISSEDVIDAKRASLIVIKYTIILCMHESQESNEEENNEKNFRLHQWIK